MPTKHPRLNVVLEPLTFRSIERLAVREGVSLSMKARDLIHEALELYEDAYLAERARERSASFVRSKALTHEEVWAHLQRSKRRL
jgi:hypothetical protein